MSRYIGNYLRVPSSEPQQASAPGVWSLSEQLNYQRANQWPPARDPYYNQTVLHLSGDVAATRETKPVTQPRTFLSDASTNNFLLTPNGDVSARPFSPYQHSYSVYFGGNYGLETTGVTAISTNDFAIEVFVYPTAYTYYAGIFGLHTNSTAYGPSIFLSTTGEVSTAIRNGTGTIGLYISSANAAPLNTWTHIALTRISGVMKTYVNGVLVYSVANTTNCDSTLMAIGQQYADYSPSGRGFTGYISNARAVSGINSVNAFTGTIPTTKLQKITGTFILACHSNRWNYDEGSNYTISADSGTPVVSASSPFVEYDTTSGSGYFDGSDYLSFTTSSSFALTGDFTVECWAYFTSSASLQPIIDQYTSAGFLLFVTPGSTINGNLYINSSAGVDGISSFTGTSCPINAWNFFRVIRSGSTVTVYCNGVSVGSRQRTGNVFVNSTAVKIGNYSTSYFTGYLSDIRIVASALTGTEVPTAPLTPVTNTQLLTLQTRAPANNQSILDTSPNSFVVTRTGNVAQGSFSPFSAGGWSNFLDGSTAYFTAAANSAINDFGTGDFNMELWFYATSSNFATEPSLLSCVVAWATSVAYQFEIRTGGIVYFFAGDSVPININSGATTVAVNTWNHVAASRASGTTRLFVNGTQVSSTNTVATISKSSTAVIIGAFSNVAQKFTGYLSNVRIVKGQALYTGNFTPPTAALTTTSVGTSGANVATSLTGTVGLLTCQSNRFLDQTGKTITVTGSPTVQPISPFAPTQAYVASQLGGSGYFPGSTSVWLVAPDNPALELGSNDFTIECWVYSTADFSSNRIFTSKWNNFVFGINSTPALSFTWYGTTNGSATGTLISTALNVWHHFAVCRQGSTLYMFQNGQKLTQSNSTITGTLNNDSYGPMLGGNENVVSGAIASANEPWYGYISGYRMVNGTALYTSSFPIPTAPPTAVPGTSLLLNFTGAGIVDATGKNVVETVGNSAVQTTQSRRPPGSMYFDGTGDAINIRSSDLLTFGTGDWTVEFWVYHTSVSGQQTYLGDTGGATSGPYIYKDSSHKVGLYYSSQILTGTTTIAINTWYYIVLSRVSGTVRLFINGIQETSASDTTNLSVAIQWVGGDTFPSGYLSGYMNDIRVTKGYARYVTGTGANANQMVFNGTNTLAVPTLPFPLA